MRINKSTGGTIWIVFKMAGACKDFNVSFLSRGSRGIRKKIDDSRIGSSLNSRRLSLEEKKDLPIRSFVISLFLLLIFFQGITPCMHSYSCFYFPLFFFLFSCSVLFSIPFSVATLPFWRRFRMSFPYL